MIGWDWTIKVETKLTVYSALKGSSAMHLPQCLAWANLRFMECFVGAACKCRFIRGGRFTRVNHNWSHINFGRYAWQVKKVDKVTNTRRPDHRGNHGYDVRVVPSIELFEIVYPNHCFRSFLKFCSGEASQNQPCKKRCLAIYLSATVACSEMASVTYTMVTLVRCDNQVGKDEDLEEDVGTASWALSYARNRQFESPESAEKHLLLVLVQKSSEIWLGVEASTS